MATHKGSEGVVKIGSDSVGECKSWSLDTSADSLDITTVGSTSRLRTTGLLSWSGSIDAFWDETDTAQSGMGAGSEITLNLYPEGADTGDTYFTGAAVVTGVSRSGSAEGLVEVSFTFEGNGDLTETTV